MHDIPFDRSFLQLSNGIRHVLPSTDTKPELTAKASMAQPISQPAVYANGLMLWIQTLKVKEFNSLPGSQHDPSTAYRPNYQSCLRVQSLFTRGC
jgi:hypothetical protein